MECQRCLEGKGARYRAYTEEMNIKICPSCAEEARKLGIAVKALDVRGKEKGKHAASPV